MSDRYAWGRPSLGPKPESLVWAIRLMYVGALLALAANALDVVLFPAEIRMRIETGTEELSASVDDILAAQLPARVTVAVISGVGAALLYAWAGVLNHLGRRGARGLATIIGGVTIGLLILRVTSWERLPAQLVADLVCMALAAVILTLLWQGDTTAYLRERRDSS